MSDPMPFDPTAADPLIMTALFDVESFARLDRLRRHYFPAALNRVPAHATLFHHLPDHDLPAIAERTAAVCRGTAPLPFTCNEIRFPGRGVALAIDCPALVVIRDNLAAAWTCGLKAQDRQGYRPHATIQNKVRPEEARDTRRELEGLLPFSGLIEGLALWHYRGGPWEAAGRFGFSVAL